MRRRIIESFDGPGRSPPPRADGVSWAGELDGASLSRAEDETPWTRETMSADGETALVRAAVLVPLIDRPDGMTVLLTQRTAHLKSHAGQISFPGGRVEEADLTPEHTALRETEEEVGLPRHHVELVGRLNARQTGTGYRVVPVVGLIDPPFPLTPDPGEVAGIFELPLEFVLDPANHRFETRIHGGVERQFYAMPYGDHYIWGLTARLLVNLAEVVSRP